MKQLAGSRGFTLMEVLVSLVILSIAFMTVFMTISSNAKNILYLQNKTAAIWIAMNVIAEAQLHIINLSDKSAASHQAVMFNKIWYWKAVVKNTENKGVSLIDVSVKMKSNTADIFHIVGSLRNES